LALLANLRAFLAPLLLTSGVCSEDTAEEDKEYWLPRFSSNQAVLPRLLREETRARNSLGD
jgi:hypothetical protein